MIGRSGSEGGAGHQPPHRLFRNDRELAECLETRDEVWLPLMALAEIKAGFYGGREAGRNEVILQRFLSRPTVGILLPARETAEHYAGSSFS